MNKKSSAAIAFASLLIIIFVSVSWPGWAAKDPDNAASWARFAFIIVLVFFIVFIIAISRGVTQRLLGFLINERNLMSLTRFQMVLWTVIILSAYFVIAVAEVIMKKGPGLALGVDKNLWGLLGISLTSLVGTSLINSTKTDKTPAENEVNKTAKALVATGNQPDPGADTAVKTAVALSAANAATTAQATAVDARGDADAAKVAADTAAKAGDPAAESKAADAAAAAADAAKADADAAAKQKQAATVAAIDNNKQGTLYANPSMDQASLSDMFEGDEVGNAAYVDLAKVQMFFFTIIVAISYVFVLLSDTMAKLATGSDPVTELPVLSAGMLALLGISHAGHLAGKTADRTKLQT
jgi:hypothetical protein